MNKKIFTFLTILTTSLTFNLFAQQTIEHSNVRQGESVEYCIYHKKMHELRQNPAFVEMNNLEQAQFRILEQQMLADTTPTRVVYKVPVVFHVLHNGGAENITNAQIVDALAILNRDYRLLNSDANNVHADFQGLPADIEIEFAFATKAPDGTCFSGITRTQSSQSFNGDNGDQQVSAIIAGNDVYNGEFPGDEYLNIFICGEIGGAAGYTMTPSNWVGSSMWNGIWVLHDYVGSIGTSGVSSSRTLTHEIGHWLNLEHTWGPNNNPGDMASCSTDDGISDTPNTIGVTACLLNEASCGPRANVENYMDYSYCSKMFTPGQKTRMRAALTSNTAGRNNLWQTNNLVATGADGSSYLCAANFYSDRLKICAGDSVRFFDNSYNNVTGWNWTFTGAVNTTSTLQNPVVYYNNPGTYAVSLVATDGNTSLTKTISAYITVLSSGVDLPFLDGFENYSSLATSNYWDVVNEQNNATFTIVSGVSQTGNKSVKLANFGQSGANADELVAYPTDLSTIVSGTGVTLSFRYSYRKRVTTNTEKLQVLITKDCGDNWSIVKTIQGSTLSSLISSTSWTPTVASDWTTAHVTNITSAFWVDNFRYKFRFEGNGGNNLYLDNINIYAGAPSEALVAGETIIIGDPTSGIVMYPNPADEELTIEYNVNKDVVTNIQILNVVGQQVKKEIINSQTGNNMVFISTADLASGVYLVKIQMEGKEMVQQLTIR